MNFSHLLASLGDVNRAQRGAILIVVLWVILAISLLALSFSASIRTEVDAARNLVEQKQAYYLARAGIEYAIYEILETQSAFFRTQRAQGFDLDAVPDVLRGSVSLTLSGGGAEVKIIDESGKINVNLAPDHLIYNLLLMIGVESQLADVITDSILDWVDLDELVHSSGAETDYYQTLSPPYVAKNGFFDVPEELLLVNGVTPEIYYGRKGLSEAGDPLQLYGLQNYLTTFTNSEQINLNSAPLPVLAAIPGLDSSIAAMIVDMRSQMPFNSPGEVAEQIPGLSGEALGYLAVAPSSIYTISSVGGIEHSRVVSRIRAVLRVDGAGRKGYAVLYWSEADTEL